MGDLVLFVVIVALIAVAGIRLGMLLAPGLGRIAGSGEEDDDGEGD